MHGCATPLSIDGSPLEEEVGEVAIVEIEDSPPVQGTPAQGPILPIDYLLPAQGPIVPKCTDPAVFIRKWPIRMIETMNACSHTPAIIWALCCPFKEPQEHCERMLEFLIATCALRNVCKYMWGKTWCPQHRWEVAKYNYKKDRYDNMFLLYCAEDCWEIGDLEADLIVSHHKKPNCMNSYKGAYKGIDVGMPPHFLYLVVGFCR